MMQLAHAWGLSNVPKRYRDVAPDKTVLGALESGSGFYLVGDNGTGKTQAACAMLKAWFARHTRADGWCSARFVSVPEWLDKMQDTYGSRASSEDVFWTAAGPHVVVLDDIGKLNSRLSEWVVGKLFRLIDTRYSEMRPTIFTSQYRLSDLSSRLVVGEDTETPDAIVSRIFEMCEQRRFDGPDKRLEKECV
jgi:DNA replication protein DnaC/primosomal protein DnaI